MIEAERQSALDAIGVEVAACTRCRLHETRTRSVPGEGSAATEVVFVGEGPGFNEDRQGRPFVGRAGGMLAKLLASIEWTREDVFITNVVKCRPPENRDPEPDEIAACAPYLTRQIQALDPALIVTLGRFSMARFNPGARIGQVHGPYAGYRFRSAKRVGLFHVPPRRGIARPFRRGRLDERHGRRSCRSPGGQEDEIRRAAAGCGCPGAYRRRAGRNHPRVRGRPIYGPGPSNRPDGPAHPLLG